MRILSINSGGGRLLLAGAAAAAPAPGSVRTGSISEVAKVVCPADESLVQADTLVRPAATASVSNSRVKLITSLQPDYRRDPYHLSHSSAHAHGGTSHAATHRHHAHPPRRREPHAGAA